MEFLKELDQAKGKTVARVVDDIDYVAIVFLDNTCLMLKAKVAYEDDARVEIEDEPNLLEKMEVGAITEDEYELARQKEREEAQAADEVRQRAAYEKLKKKFENE